MKATLFKSESRNSSSSTALPHTLSLEFHLQNYSKVAASDADWIIGILTFHSVLRISKGSRNKFTILQLHNVHSMWVT